ncbi:hypothetical protein EYF80_017274 [Liparis tanakae]|uniref:Uncharacterized protein n=1 Tax=Liparis tanakae TaxID=230148 RepID=A0A4Z2I3H9_9TELE|nr:hypothetical protein EYF80_017274 [Liparis tanakae]
MTSRQEQLNTTLRVHLSMSTTDSADTPSRQGSRSSPDSPSSPPLTITAQTSAPAPCSSAPLAPFSLSLRLPPRESRGNLVEESIGVVVTYSCRVRVAMERNFSDFSAAFSAFTAFARRKSLKAAELGNRAPLGKSGPNNGMSLERVTATLRGREENRSARPSLEVASLTPCSSSFSRVSLTLGEFEAKRRQCRFSSGMMNSSSLLGDRPRGVV